MARSRTKISGGLITDASITSADLGMSVARGPDLDFMALKIGIQNNLNIYNLKDGIVDRYNDASGVDASASTNETRDSSGKYYSGYEEGSLVENNYSYTGSTTTLAVTAGYVYTIKTWGAGGGNGAQQEAGSRPGGAGGFSTGTYSFGSNTTLVIGAGGAGLKGNQSSSGGFMGGGPRGPILGAPNFSGGANGGGYSGVFVGSLTHANTLQIAGGGGGGYYYGPHGGADAGGGGGTSGTDSASGSGGSQSAGGTGSGPAGSALQGGTGGNGSDGIGGSGGGGGYYGGAGSGGYNNGGGSGGGGSGFVATTATINSVAVTAESAGSTVASVGTSMNSTGSSDSKYPGGGVGNEQSNGAAYISHIPKDYNNMTLVSNAQTAQAAPTLGRIMVLDEASTGTTTINSDVKAYISRDNGTTYSQVTLTDDGEYATGKRMLSGSVDISGQPSGTSMRYKIETLNQSATKITRIYGTALMW